MPVDLNNGNKLRETICGLCEHSFPTILHSQEIYCPEGCHFPDETHEGVEGSGVDSQGEDEEIDLFPNLGVAHISYKKEEHSHQVAHKTGVENGFNFPEQSVDGMDEVQNVEENLEAADVAGDQDLNSVLPNGLGREMVNMDLKYAPGFVPDSSVLPNIDVAGDQDLNFRDI